MDPRGQAGWEDNGLPCLSFGSARRVLVRL